VPEFVSVTDPIGSIALPRPFTHESGYRWSAILDAELAARCREAALLRQHEFLGVRFYANGKPTPIYSYTQSPVERFGHGMFHLDLHAEPPRISFSSGDNSDPSSTDHQYSLMLSRAVRDKPAATEPLAIKEFEEILIPMAVKYLKLIDYNDAYYGNRIKINCIFSGYEYEIANYLLHNFLPEATAIVEVGSGLGQILLFLASRGFSTVGLDRAWDRLRGAALLKAECGELYPEIDDRCHSLHADFPAVPLPVYPDKRNIALFTNLGIGLPEEFCDRAIDALAPADFALIDMDRFFRNRDSDEQLVLQKKIENKYHTHGVEIAKTGAYRLMLFPLK
jgi:hypothetical protein